MIYLLDANAISDLMREHPTVRARLANLSAGDEVITCTIVRGEIQYGISALPAGKRQQELQTKANHLLSAIPCEAIPAAAGDHYATTKLARARAGLTLDENDLWIAATALALGAVLVTHDTDFRKIAGLTVEDWSA
jgi:tRNA(fMet)-specific endonuclease VapC